MPLYSYHVSQEQFAPRHLIDLVCRAEAAGFDAAFSSDHLQPWAPAQGHSAFVWTWLGAALQATQKIRLGTITVPGGWRYQPVVLAQAIATLASMFPGRLPWVALGSGEAVNECATGLPWPDKPQRNERLEHAAAVMRGLLAGETVTAAPPCGALDARLWCRPSPPPILVGAATTPETAEWLGGWADGLLTVASDLRSLEANITAFRRGGGQGKPVHVKLDLSWAPTEDEALRQAHENWRFNGAGSHANAQLRQPEDFVRATEGVVPDDVRQRVLVSSDLAVHRARLEDCAGPGVDSIDLHQVGLNQEAFIDAFGDKVLPHLQRS